MSSSSAHYITLRFQCSLADPASRPRHREHWPVNVHSSLRYTLLPLPHSYPSVSLRATLRAARAAVRIQSMHALLCTRCTLSMYCFGRAAKRSGGKLVRVCVLLVATRAAKYAESQPSTCVRGLEQGKLYKESGWGSGEGSMLFYV